MTYPVPTALSRIRGDNATLTLALVHPDTGAPFNPTGYSLLFTVKQTELAADTAALLQKSSLTGGLTATTGTATLSLVPADTADLEPRLPYYADLRAQHTSTGARLTVWRGTLTLEPDITREETLSIPTIVINPDVGYLTAAQIQALHDQTEDYKDAAAASASAASASATAAAAALAAAEATALQGVDTITWLTLGGRTNAATARTDLGLAIGTHVQAQSATLDLLAALSTTAPGRSLLTLATVPASALVGLTDTQTLTNKTLTTPTIDRINGGTADGDMTLAPLGTGRIAYAYADSLRIWLGKYPWDDATGTDNAVMQLRTAASTGAGSFLRFDRSRGTLTTPTAVQAGDYLAAYSARGHDGTSYGAHSDISFELAAYSNFTPTSHASYFRWVNTPAASTTKFTSMRLLPNGDLSLGYPGGNDQGEISPERGYHAFGSQGRAVVMDTYSASENPLFIGRRARGTYGAGTAVQAGDILVALGGRGLHNSGAFSSGSRGGLRVLASQSWTIGAQGAYVEIFATADGATAATTIAGFSPTAVTIAPTLVTAASTTTRAGLRVPHGSAPTAPTDGDIWTTTAGCFIRINGVTKTFTTS